MKIIYLDELFLLNLAIDYFILLATAKVCALPCRRGRMALGAGLGSLWCCLGQIPACAFLNAPLLRPASALAMTVIAFGRERKLLRCFLSFLAVSALFGGAVYAAALWHGSGTASGPLVHISFRVLVFSLALCWAVVSLVFHRSAEPLPKQYCTVVLEKNGLRTEFRALRDTGNRLCDPISGCGVFVAEAEVLHRLYPDLNMRVFRGPAVDAIALIPGSRLVPCSTIGGERRLLLAFRPDRITVDGVERDDLLAAVSPAPIGTDGFYQAVL